MTAVIGVKPGWRWTSGVLRIGETAVDGFTLGPVGTRRANDRMEPDAIYGYTERIGFHLDAIYDRAVEMGHGRPGVAVELPTGPQGGKGHTSVLRAFLITWTVAWFVIGRFDAVPIPADGNGRRHLPENGGTGKLGDYYPTALIRRRPETWTSNETDRNERGRERAAYDVAGHLLTPAAAA